MKPETKRRRERLRWLLAALVGCAGTGDDPGNDDAIDAWDVLGDTTDAVILPTYAAFEERADDLSDALEALCDAPSEGRLEDAREAWRAARVPWKRAEAFGFGPVMDLRIDRAIDFWPARLDTIEEALAEDVPVTDELIRTAGSAAKGFPVLEFLLFDPQADDAAVLARLDEGPTDGRNCEYLAALGRDLAGQASRLHDAWDPEGGDFRGELVRAGRGSDTYGEVFAAVSAVVDRMIGAAQTMEGMKLAKPMGLRDGGEPQPRSVESPWAETAVRDLRDNLVGLRAMYIGELDGAGGVSFSDFVGASSAALDRSLRERFDECEDALEDIDGTLAVAVVDDFESVQAAFDCHDELLGLLQVDLAGALGVTPTFNDNDGD